MSESAAVELAPLDEKRFGVRTAKARLAAAADVLHALDFCRAEQVRLLMARCPSTALPAAHALEAAGGRLMDVLVYYVRDLARPLGPARDDPPVVRPASPDDAPAVAAVARAAFAGYCGHYHADPRLDPRQCDAVYVDWAERSCRSRTVADEVLLASRDGVIQGFVTLRLRHPEGAEVPLVGVAPDAQGRGTAGALLVRAMEWCRSQAAARLLISTQIVNAAAQRAYGQVGFEASHSELTFHLWLGD